MIALIGNLKRRLAGALTPGTPDYIVPGTVIDDRFEIVRPLGEGGTSTVFGARQISMNREIALKILRPDMVTSGNARRSFVQEVTAVSRLTSPHTISVYDVGESPEGLLYIAMELLRGRSLHQLTLEEPGPMKLDRAVALMEQILNSVEEAHDAGVLHRDLKPENIFVMENKGSGFFAKVLDFGVARLEDSRDSLDTRRGLVFGTPLYMSPEHMEGRDVDARSDLYSLGMILFELLAGRPPFTEADPLQLALRKRRAEAPSLSKLNPEAHFPPEVEAFVGRCLSRARGRRPSDTAEFRNLLLIAADGCGEEPEPERLRARDHLQERRSTARVRKTVSTRFVMGGREHRATTTDMDVKGAYIHSKALPDAGQRLEFNFSDSRDPSTSLGLVGEVVRVVDVADGPGEIRGFGVKWRFAEAAGPAV